MDGQRILKLLPGTSCAVSAIGVEISSPPGTVTGEGETPSHPAKDNPGLSGKEKSGATGKEETPSHRCGGNPGPPAKGNSRLSGKEKSGATGKGQLPAFGQGEVRRHRQGGNSEPPVRGKPRATRYWANSGASGLGGSLVPPGKRGTRKGELRATGAGKTSRYVAEGKPRVMCGEESSGPSAKGKLQVVRRRGNPELRNEKKALSHPAKGKLEPFDLGKPRSFGEEKALSHR